MGLLECFLGIFPSCFIRKPFGGVLRLVLGNKAPPVLRREIKVKKMFLLDNIKTILAVEELYQRSIGVADSIVVLHRHTFEMLNKTSLKISRTRCFDCGIDKAFSSGHAIEKVLLGSNASKITRCDVSACSNICVECRKTR